MKCCFSGSLVFFCLRSCTSCLLFNLSSGVLFGAMKTLPYFSDVLRFFPTLNGQFCIIFRAKRDFHWSYFSEHTHADAAIIPNLWLGRSTNTSRTMSLTVSPRSEVSSETPNSIISCCLSFSCTTDFIIYGGFDIILHDLLITAARFSSNRR